MTTSTEALALISDGLTLAQRGITAAAELLKAAEPRYDAASLAQLVAAIKAAEPGATVRLAPGAYGILNVRDVAAAGVHVVGDGVTLAGLGVTNSGGVSFEGFTVALTADPYSQVIAQRCRGVAFRRMRSFGKATAYGFNFRDSENIAVEDCEAIDVKDGVVGANSRGVLILRNRVRRVRADAINMCGVSDLIIAENDLSDFASAEGAHPDAIQLHTAAALGSAENIYILRNRITRGAGGLMQGVFATDQSGGAKPYINVTIAGNLIVGAMANGIGAANVRGLTLTRNTVQPIEGQGSRIHLAGINGGRVAENLYAALTQASGASANVGLEILDKASLQPISAGAAAAL